MSKYSVVKERFPPYYESDKAILFNADCLDILPLLEPGSVDAIFADPPYGVGFSYEGSEDRRDGYIEQIPAWFSVMNAPIVMVTPGIVNVCFWPQPRWIAAWMKTNSMGASGLSGPKTVSRNLWEPILWYGQYPRNQMSRDIIHSPIATSEDGGGHPCPKPNELMRQLVAGAIRQGEIICDPFMGSGTTGVACMKLGRKFIGIEIEPKYCEIAKRRIAEAESQFALFEPPRREIQAELNLA